MPIYEFICESCNTPFEKFVLSAREVKGVVCPRCGSSSVKKLISSFSCCSSRSGQGGSMPTATCGTTRFG